MTENTNIHYLYDSYIDDIFFFYVLKLHPQLHYEDYLHGVFPIVICKVIYVIVTI